MLKMPVARYFFMVGGLLLALLFIADAQFAKVPVADSTRTDVDKTVIRIHSDRKWPERVVFDTSVPAIVPAVTANAETAKSVANLPAADVPAPATVVANVSGKAQVREAFAQLKPSDPVKPHVKPQLRKHKIVRRRFAPPTMLVAQQPQFGFFANNTW